MLRLCNDTLPFTFLSLRACVQGDDIIDSENRTSRRTSNYFHLASTQRNEGPAEIGPAGRPAVSEVYLGRPRIPLAVDEIPISRYLGGHSPGRCTPPCVQYLTASLHGGPFLRPLHGGPHLSVACTGTISCTEDQNFKSELNI